MLIFSILTTIAFGLLWIAMIGRVFLKKNSRTSLLSPAHNFGLVSLVSVSLILLVVSVWIFV